jgi:hypothetical protein
MQYPGYWARGGDWRWDPGRFAEAAREVLDAHLVPILFLSSGEGGTGWELGPTGLVDGYIKALKERGLLPYVWLVPGFEVVGPSGGWSSHELSTALLTIHGLAPGIPLGVHLQPERPAGASRPLEADDPWHGDELQFWTSHGGEYVDALLYQTQHGRDLLAPDGARDPYVCRGGVNPCGQWEGRWIEVLERLGVGGHGWRQVSLSFFEVTGSDYFRNRATDEDVVRLSNRARQLCGEWGVRCTYGNGLPR